MANREQKVRRKEDTMKVGVEEAVELPCGSVEERDRAQCEVNKNVEAEEGPQMMMRLPVRLHAGALWFPLVCEQLPH